MSLFDVIKYGNIDINSRDELNQLPCEVVKKWRALVVEHACQSAELDAHRDKSGKCQELIDMTRKYMRGEVDKDTLLAAKTTANAAYNTAHLAAYCAAIYAAYYAANAAYCAAYCAANAARDITRDAAMKLYQEWIMEELLKHESGEFCE